MPTNENFFRYFIIFFLPSLLFNDYFKKHLPSIENPKETRVEGRVSRGRSLATHAPLVTSSQEQTEKTEFFRKKSISVISVSA